MDYLTIFVITVIAGLTVNDVIKKGGLRKWTKFYLHKTQNVNKYNAIEIICNFIPKLYAHEGWLVVDLKIINRGSDDVYCENLQIEFDSNVIFASDFEFINAKMYPSGRAITININPQGEFEPATRNLKHIGIPDNAPDNFSKRSNPDGLLLQAGKPCGGYVVFFLNRLSLTNGSLRLTDSITDESYHKKFQL